MEKYIIYPAFNGWKGTTEQNYNSRIQNAFKINDFKKSNGFYTVLDVVNFVNQFFKIDRENIIVID